MWKLLVGCLLLLSTPVAARPGKPIAGARVAIEAAMADSATGWNAGDIARFMRVYSDAPQTSFVTRQGLLRGKTAMAARYRKNYDFDHAAARGVLTFATLDCRVLDPTHALYIARYSLTASDGTKQSGITSLVFRRERAGWRIIADHSS